MWDAALDSKIPRQVFCAPFMTKIVPFMTKTARFFYYAKFIVH